MAGASGYLGSLVVEQLLRTTDVGKVYVLIRGKRGQTAKERLRKLLQSGLFHMVRENVTLLRKVGRMDSRKGCQQLLGVESHTRDNLLLLLLRAAYQLSVPFLISATVLSSQFAVQ